MNVITGLPRSGSTLLCNILNENPNFHASSTSNLTVALRAFIQAVTNTSETKSDLAHDRKMTEARVKRCAKGLVTNWYNNDTRTVFDKSRGWSLMAPVLRAIDPDAKIIVCIRDLREVVASIERQHQKFPLFDGTGGTQARQLVVNLFSETGMVGVPLRGIRDLLDRQIDVYWLRYEDMVADPELTFEKLYCYLLEEPFKHNFEDVQKTATDLDALYLNKFPHGGTGKVEDRGYSWPKQMAPGLAQEIFQSVPWYNQAFGYKPKKVGNVPRLH